MGETRSFMPFIDSSQDIPHDSHFPKCCPIYHISHWEFKMRISGEHVHSDHSKSSHGVKLFSWIWNVDFKKIGQWRFVRVHVEEYYGYLLSYLSFDTVSILGWTVTIGNCPAHCRVGVACLASTHWMSGGPLPLPQLKWKVSLNIAYCPHTA